MINHSTLELPYSVIHTGQSSTSFTMVNEATFNFKAWLHSDFEPYDVSLSTEPVDGSAGEVPVGTAHFPKMSFAPGKTSFGFTNSVEVVDQELFNKQFLHPMFGEGKKMKLFLEVKGLKLKELGFLPCPGLSMKKSLICHAVPKDEAKAKNLDQMVNMPSDLQGNDAQQYAMQCVKGIGESSEPVHV
jgi:hypothetical protein